MAFRLRLYSYATGESIRQGSLHVKMHEQELAQDLERIDDGEGVQMSIVLAQSRSSTTRMMRHLSSPAPASMT